MRILKFPRWLGFLDRSRIPVVNLPIASECVGIEHVVLPDNYLRGYRRLAKTVAELEWEYGSCTSCKHAQAFITWHCERYGNRLNCHYEPCYVALTLSKRDLNHDHWLSLPTTTPHPEVQTLQLQLLQKYQGKLFNPEYSHAFRQEIKAVLNKHYS